MFGWKLWLARRLAPAVFLNAQRYERMLSEVSYERQWLAYDFPKVGAFAERLLVSDHNHWRSLDEEPVQSRWHWNISDFREQLRRGEARTQAK